MVSIIDGPIGDAMWPTCHRVSGPPLGQLNGFQLPHPGYNPQGKKMLASQDKLLVDWRMWTRFVVLESGIVLAATSPRCIYIHR